MRGAVVIELLDEEGNVLSEYNKKEPVGDLRTLKVGTISAVHSSALSHVPLLGASRLCTVCSRLE